jgi:hypothetical protein
MFSTGRSPGVAEAGAAAADGVESAAGGAASLDRIGGA